MTALQEAKARLAALYSRTPRIITDSQQKHADQKRLMVLADLGEDNILWNVMLSYADEHARNELATALMPNLSDGARQYSAGRAASAEDFATALRDLRLHAEHKARQIAG